MRNEICMKINFETLSQEILNSNSFILTTHKDCDADGLGSILALHFALTKMGKKVYSVCVDSISPRYDFMNHQEVVHIYKKKSSIPKADCALIFDTNDSNLIEPLYGELQTQTKKRIFIDHHSPLSHLSKDLFYIEENSASTGEICYLLLEKIKALPLDSRTSQALFISIIFDTHFFKSKKNLSQTFYVCSKICKDVQMSEIYENLFCQYDATDWDNLIYLLNKIQYDQSQRIAFIECFDQEVQKRKIRMVQILDCLDLFMKRKSVEVGFTLFETNNGKFKVSLRSKKIVDVSQVAEKLGGGGHKRSAGALIDDKKKVLPLVQKALND